jgi:hypothetical protein
MDERNGKLFAKINGDEIRPEKIILPVEMLNVLNGEK